VRQDRFLLTRAVLRHFTRHPRSFVRLLRTPRPSADAARTRAVSDWRATNTVRSDRTPDGVADEIRAWRDRYAPGTSVASIVYAGLVNAFHEVGLIPDPAGLVLLVDGRRYLRKGWQAGPNFVVGQYLAVPDPRDPRDIHRTLHAAMATGVPTGWVTTDARPTAAGGGTASSTCAMRTSPRELGGDPRIRPYRQQCHRSGTE